MSQLMHLYRLQGRLIEAAEAAEFCHSHFTVRRAEYAASAAALRHAAGDLAGAQQAYRQALLEQPVTEEDFFALGMAHLAMEQWPAAEHAFRRATVLDPDSTEAWNNLGWALAQQRKLEEARAAYDRALRIDPSFQGAIANLQLLDGTPAD
jgi:superkiller protein 3